MSTTRYKRQMNVFDKIKNKPKENYNVFYFVGNKKVVCRADDVQTIKRMDEAGYVPIMIESIDGTECYETLFSI